MNEINKLLPLNEKNNKPPDTTTKENEKTEKKGFSLKKIKLEYLIVIVLALVGLFIVWSTFSTKTTTESPKETYNYVNTLESKLETSLSKVEGAGKVDVIVSVESGMMTVLATEKVTDSNGKNIESPLLVNGKTVELTESYPNICGVVVVCEGARNLSVKVAVLNAVCVYLNIDESKVEILPMK